MPRKRFVISACLALAIGVTLHFVPLYSKQGTLDTGLCQGYNLENGQQPPYIPHNYRIIEGGLSGFSSDKKQFIAGKYDGVTCGEAITLRLFLW